MSLIKSSNVCASMFFAVVIIFALVFGGAAIGYRWRGALVPASISIAQDEIERGMRLISRCQTDLHTYTMAMDSIHAWLHRGVPMDTLFIISTAKSDG